MGFTPDFERVSEDPRYAALVYQGHILTGNVSFFDQSVFNYATHTSVMAYDTLVDNVIEYVSTLERAHHALMLIEDDAWVKDDLLACDCAALARREVVGEIEILDAWLEGDE